MSMSIDYRQLESLYSLASALEVLKDPQKLQDTLTELKANVEELRTLNKEKTDMETADQYIAGIYAEGEKYKKDLLEREKALDKANDDLLEAKKAFAQEVVKKNAELEDLKSQALADQTLAANTLAQVQADQVALAQKQAEVDAQLADITTKEASLADKAVKLKEILA